MTAPVMFAFGTYLTAVLCLVFCLREWLFGGVIHALKQLVMLLFFILAYWLLESWAGVRAPFYEYAPDNPFPHVIPRFDFSGTAAWLNTIGFGGIASLLGPSPAALVSDCAILPHPTTIPLCIPVAGGCISFGLLWTVRLLLDGRSIADIPLVPVYAPWMVGFMAFWLDMALDPVLANTVNCDAVPELTHTGLQFWTWHADATLADDWFHIPAYNYGVWFSAPAILTAIALLAQWAYLKFIDNAAVGNADGVIRALILFFIGVIVFVSPSSANQIAAIYGLIVSILLIGTWTLAGAWQGFRRNNVWRWELIAGLGFFFLFPVFGFAATDYFLPAAEHVWLLLLTLLIAGWGIFFVVSPYWQLRLPPPAILPILLTLLTAALLFAYLGQS